ncbi:MAG: hypothetical protein KJ049_08405 [Gammaproteobacteria bacterium]|nr:hypothetical protein [Gammaproteobacteria bacterium]
MATADKRADGGSAKDADSEVNLAGWDPYIVALTSSPRQEAALESGAKAASDRIDGRKIQLMAWLNEHNR